MAPFSAPRLQRVLVASLIAVLLLSPLTCTLARIFALDEYVYFSVGEMAWALIKIVPQSFANSIVYFVGIPIGTVSVRAAFPRLANALQLAVLLLGIVTSVLGLPLLMDFGAASRSGNVLANVLVVDFLTMWAWHAALCLRADLAPITLIGGPLAGICAHVLTPRRHFAGSITVGIFVMYGSVGSLHREFRRSPAHLLTSTLPLVEWKLHELYAAYTVVCAFLCACVSIPVPRNARECAQICAYIVLLNANVAVAWIVGGALFVKPVARPREVVETG